MEEEMIYLISTWELRVGTRAHVLLCTFFDKICCVLSLRWRRGQDLPDVFCGKVWLTQLVKMIKCPYIKTCVSYDSVLDRNHFVKLVLLAVTEEYVMSRPNLSNQGF